MIYTSYFSNHRNFGDLTPISIARFSPKWFEGECIYDTQFKNIVPNRQLLNDFKHNNLSEVEYAQRYVKLIIDVNFKLLYNSYQDYVFLCYEKKGDFCHRHVLRFIMNRFGFKMEEL